jgi:hypothetical protein
MADTKITANGLGVTIWWALPNAFANPKSPTAAEINAGAVNVTSSVSWANYSFGSQASNQTSDPSMADVGNTQTRGFAQFGGTISFFYPLNYTDSSNENLITFEALDVPRTLGYVLIRIDGKKSTVGQAAVNGDFLRVYKVMTDGWSDVNTGEENFKYSITFQPQGDVWTNVVVGPVTVVTPVAIGTAAYTVGGKTALGTYITGRQLDLATGIYNGYPGWFNWTSSAPNIATVDKNGVVKGVAAGAASITATWPLTGAVSTPLSVTIV